MKPYIVHTMKPYMLVLNPFRQQFPNNVFDVVHHRLRLVLVLVIRDKKVVVEGANNVKVNVSGGCDE